MSITMPFTSKLTHHKSIPCYDIYLKINTPHLLVATILPQIHPSPLQRQGNDYHYFSNNLFMWGCVLVVVELSEEGIMRRYILLYDMGLVHILASHSSRFLPSLRLQFIMLCDWFTWQHCALYISHISNILKVESFVISDHVPCFTFNTFATWNQTAYPTLLIVRRLPSAQKPCVYCTYLP